jgi:protein-L-isoaspartate(D-aspartate) O-methyltransferase
MNMIEKQLKRRGIQDPRVLDAMREVRRKDFVPPAYVDQAEADRALPIGHNQTISQPYIVALMTELARPGPDDRALDVGTGCGYQAAILSRLVAKVYSIELVAELGEQSRQRLDALGYHNVQVKIGNGYEGWAEQAPFDVIVVAAAPPAIPETLIEQLADGGRLVLPVGSRHNQDLWLIEKSDKGVVSQKKIAPVVFVPMIDREST